MEDRGRPNRVTELAQNEGLNRQNDSKRPRTRNIHRNVPRDVPDHSVTTQRGPDGTGSHPAFLGFFYYKIVRSDVELQNPAHV